jgi:hypothetical protein
MQKWRGCWESDVKRLLILSQCTAEIFSKIILCMNGETNCVFLSGFTLPSCFFIVTGINFRYTNVVFIFWFDKVNSMHIGSEVTIYCLLCVPIGLCRKETERVFSFHFKMQPELGTGLALRCSILLFSPFLASTLHDVSLLFVRFPGVTTHCGCIFHSLVAEFCPSFSRFLNHTKRRATFGRIALDEWSIRRRAPYLTTHNTHNRQTSMPPLGFEPTISAGERQKTYALDRTATGTVTMFPYLTQIP